MDQLFISRLLVPMVIGIHPWEQEHPQPVEFDLQLSVDSLALAATSENLENTLDFDRAVLCVQRVVAKQRYYLIESLATQLIVDFFKEFTKLQEMSLTIRKVEIQWSAQAVGITLHRDRKSLPVLLQQLATKTDQHVELL